MPVLGIGTWQMRGDEARRSVAQALDVGYRHIDTAEMYRNEREVGAAIHESGLDRNELFITSKAWTTNLARDALRAALLESLERLGTPYLDLYLIHWPSQDIPVDETIGALDELRQEGLIRAFGVSNFGIRNLDKAMGAHPDVAVNQVEFHPFLYQKELHEYCEERNVILTAYSPIARGAVIGNATLTDIGAVHEKSSVQIALRWIVQKGIVAIPKASSLDHIRSNFDIFDFELSREEMERIDALNEDRRLIAPESADWS